MGLEPSKSNAQVRAANQRVAAPAREMVRIDNPNPPKGKET